MTGAVSKLQGGNLLLELHEIRDQLFQPFVRTKTDLFGRALSTLGTSCRAATSLVRRVYSPYSAVFEINPNTVSLRILRGGLEKHVTRLFSPCNTPQLLRYYNFKGSGSALIKHKGAFTNETYLLRGPGLSASLRDYTPVV